MTPLPEQSGGHQWVVLVPMVVTADEIERALRTREPLVMDNSNVDMSHVPPPGCYRCECLFTSAASLRPCPGGPRL
jgi:hypothetical protein